MVRHIQLEECHYCPGNNGIPLIVYDEPFTDENKLQPKDSNLYAPAALIGFSALT